ncbi:MAG TPA: ABC transporter substrate-binding protein [Chloroflexota bacterium]|nr:ABC transporter substrate-binding protein [Chloroflexota bacterium]
MQDARHGRDGALTGIVTRRAVLVGIGAAMTSLLAACGGSAPAPSAPASGSGSAPTTAPTTAAAAPPVAAPAATTAPAGKPASGAAAAPAATDLDAAAAAIAKEVGWSPEDDRVGVTDTEIKIGSWQIFSGPQAASKVQNDAYEGYFKMLNEQGGVHGRKITWIPYDDGYDPSRTPGVAKKLIEEDKVFSLVGAPGTPNNLAVMQYVLEKKVPNFFPQTGSSRWSTPLNRTYFGLSTNYTVDGTLLAEYAIKEMSAKKIATLYQDDAFGREGADGFKATFEKLGSKPIVEIGVQPADSDYSSAVLKLQQADPDVVCQYIISSSAAKLANECQKQGFTKPFVGSYVTPDPSFLKLSGEAAEGYVFGSVFPLADSDDPGVKKYIEVMNKYEPQTVIGVLNQWAYANAETFGQVLQVARRNLTRSRLIAAAESLKDWSGDLARNVSYSPTDHRGMTSIFLVQVKGGKLVQIAGYRGAA